MPLGQGGERVLELLAPVVVKDVDADLRQSSSVRSRASQSDFSQRRIRSSPGSAASQAKVATCS